MDSKFVNGQGKPKRLIGILAGHDTPERSNQLVELFIDLYRELTERKKIEWFSENYHFVFTGGTFCRLILGYDPTKKDMVKKSSLFRTLINEDRKELREFISSNSTVLPPYNEGGIILLTHLIVQRQCSILWSFLTPFGSHWIIPENLALLRLCDFNNVKKQMNYGSAIEWVKNSMEVDSLRNKTIAPPPIYPGCEKGYDIEKILESRKKSILQPGNDFFEYVNRYLPTADDDAIQQYLKSAVEKNTKDTKSIVIPSYQGDNGLNGPWYCPHRANRTIALIAHDGMKDRMVTFAVDFEEFLSGYSRIVTTSTTGDKIRRSTRKLGEKIDACYSGPKGGDIEIAVQILIGDIQTVVFFIDPTSPHAHIDDIRVVFGAAMINRHVRMLTNERQARDRFNDIIIKEAKAKAENNMQ